MLERIQTAVYNTYKQTDMKGLFLSLYDGSWDFLWSQWSIQPQKDIATLIPLLYDVLSSDASIGSAVVDVVLDIQEITQKDVLAWLDMHTCGMCVLSGAVSWVLLPETAWISSSKDALSAIKRKYSITGKIRIFSFTTDRIVVA